MLRSDLIKEFQKKNPELNLSEIEFIVETFFKTIEKALHEGKKVELRGFGVFSSNIQKARISRNPKTGEKVNTPTKKTIHFKMSKEMFKKLNNDKE